MKKTSQTRDNYKLIPSFQDLNESFCVIQKFGWIGGFQAIGRALQRRILRRQDRKFDKLHAVQTEGNVEFRDLNTLRGVQEFCESYEPMHVNQFPYVIAELPKDLRKFVFIDFGAGKGRVVLLAAHYSFRKVIGVEFAEELYHCMRMNIQNYSNGTLLCPDVEAICADATTFALPNAPCVLFFFNPFQRVVLAQVASNIQRSYSECPRPIYIVFLNPKESNGAEAIFGQMPGVEKVTTKLEGPLFRVISPWQCVIYRMEP
jgi:hypothetical protein